MRLERSTRRLSFVDRGSLLAFSQSHGYFRDHWSTHALPGGTFRSSHAAIVAAVPCLAALMADVQRKVGAPTTAASLRAITLVPHASTESAPSVELPSGPDADDACVIYCDGDFARVRWIRANRTGGPTRVQAALIFHFEPEVSTRD